MLAQLEPTECASGDQLFNSDMTEQSHSNEDILQMHVCAHSQSTVFVFLTSIKNDYGKKTWEGERVF